ncbi:hypothetical protein D3C85_1665060 [compost metagenome]
MRNRNSHQFCVGKRNISKCHAISNFKFGIVICVYNYASPFVTSYERRIAFEMIISFSAVHIGKV